MAMRLIGAGLPRTGTLSLKTALEHLLGAPVYHMRETFQHPEHAPVWVAALRGESPDWPEFLAGYAAGVDAPFSTCWRELAEANPDAPVLLSRRADAETWMLSMDATVLPRIREIGRAGASDPMGPLFAVVLDHVCHDLGDGAGLMAGYDRWLERVRAEAPSGRLVEWQPGDGWGPLCRALDLPVPDVPFPHENSRAPFRARDTDRHRRDAERQQG